MRTGPGAQQAPHQLSLDRMPHRAQADNPCHPPARLTGTPGHASLRACMLLILKPASTAGTQNPNVHPQTLKPHVPALGLGITQGFGHFHPSHVHLPSAGVQQHFHLAPRKAGIQAEAWHTTATCLQSPAAQEPACQVRGSHQRRVSLNAQPCTPNTNASQCTDSSAPAVTRAAQREGRAAMIRPAPAPASLLSAHTASRRGPGLQTVSK